MSVTGARQRGFSLIELAVALVIVGLLLGGTLGTVSAMQQRQRVAQTGAQLEEMRDALVAFAVVNRRLPCPADPTLADSAVGAGLERAPTAGGCTGGNAGAVPWATLGLAQTDAWGRRFSYRVSAGFARLAPAFTLASSGDNVVRNAAAVILAGTAPAVIVSHGANARGSRGPAGSATPASPDARELENSDGDGEFVADTPTESFDDQVVWLPGTVLAYRMLQAGVLP